MTVQEPDSSDNVTLLVIDDDSQLRALCRKCLVRAGFRVLEADSGLEALLVASNYEGLIDLLITDVELPHISGPEVAEAFKALWPRTRVLFISGSYSESARGDLGLDAAFLPKPFLQDKLLKTVGSLVAAHKPPKHDRRGS
jgi:two-component system, cell cycle sensor histidine kinase and response regulator CckA